MRTPVADRVVIGELASAFAMASAMLGFSATAMMQSILLQCAVRDAKLMRGGSDIGAEMQTAVERSLAIPEGHLTRFFAELTG